MIQNKVTDLSCIIVLNCGTCYQVTLIHWGRMTHICASNLTIIGSDNGLSPSRHQAIIWANVEILLIGPLGLNFSEMFIKIYTFLLKKTCLIMSSAKCCPFRLGPNVLNASLLYMNIVTKSLNGILPYPWMTLISFKCSILNILSNVLCFLSKLNHSSVMFYCWSYLENVQ